MNDPAATPPSHVSTIQNPPTSLLGSLSRLGPGLIIAGSIVGSGELIATTKTGAEAGFTLLWLIIVGCIIKVFVQVEFGRYALVNGKTSMEGMNEVPGPRLVVNWLIWYWLIMFSVMTAQLGGIAGGVGQCLAIACPITGDYCEFAANYDRQLEAEKNLALDEAASAGGKLDEKEAKILASRKMDQRLRAQRDDVYWTLLLAVVTSALLLVGRYRMIEIVSTILVAGFTFVTLAGVVGLQLSPETAFTWSDIAGGLTFQLPANTGGRSPLVTALATFGIIGVGASELIAYPYWCLEKGYARYTGPRDSSPAWGERTRGWMRVLRLDAGCSMIVYTLATLAFYFMGAAVLHKQNRPIDDAQMIPVLAEMYDRCPLFLGFGAWVLFVGAFAVLYSTFFVATAGNARMAGDAARLFRLGVTSDAGVRRVVWILSGVLPFVSFAIYAVSKKTVTVVLLSGLTQGLMLPMLGIAALYFRYVRGDDRVRPGRLWDVLLWISILCLAFSGCYGVFAQVMKLFP